MARLIAIVGNSGVGKSTLARCLVEHRGCAQALEDHAGRAFHHLCREDPQRYAFANQIDFLLYRADQEAVLRARRGEAIVDGGLDLDFHGFTRLFQTRGYLSQDEFGLCRRLYLRLRSHLPPPDILLHLHAPLAIVQQRFAARARPLELTRPEDLPLLEQFIDDWLADAAGSMLMRVDASQDEPDYRHALAILDHILDAPPAG
jgi:deoxyadenosine/deoxycytidine kinase